MLGSKRESLRVDAEFDRESSIVVPAVRDTRRESNQWITLSCDIE